MAETIALSNARKTVQIRGGQLVASVRLIKTIGGGWNATALTKDAREYIYMSRPFFHQRSTRVIGVVLLIVIVAGIWRESQNTNTLAPDVKTIAVSAVERGADIINLYSRIIGTITININTGL